MPTYLLAELRRVQLIFRTIESVIGAQVDLLPALLPINIALHLGCDHRFIGPATEELIPSLDVEDCCRPGLLDCPC